MAKLRKFVEKNFEYVGENFPREVRKVYYDKKRNKNIYGITTPEEAQELKEEGITIFLVEQNASQALALADRGYVLETGKVVIEGTGRELLSNEKVREAYLGM